MLDFSKPGAASDERHPDAVFNEEAVIHRIRHIAHDGKIEGIGCDLVEVAGFANEIPSSLKIGRDYLFFLDAMNFCHAYKTRQREQAY